MKKTFISGTLVFATLMSGAALAHDDRSLIGTWTGVSNVAVMGNVAKHHKPDDGSGVKFVLTSFTIVIDAQQGRNFSGHWKSDSHEEKMAGAVMSDGNGVMVDEDGSAIFKRTSDNRLELCYTHVPNPANQSVVAACVEYTRQ